MKYINKFNMVQHNQQCQCGQRRLKKLQNLWMHEGEGELSS